MMFLSTSTALNGHIISNMLAVDPLLSGCLTGILAVLVVVIIISIEVFSPCLFLYLDLVNSPLREPLVTFLAPRQVPPKTEQPPNDNACSKDDANGGQCTTCFILTHRYGSQLTK